MSIARSHTNSSSAYASVAMGLNLKSTFLRKKNLFKIGLLLFFLLGVYFYWLGVFFSVKGNERIASLAYNGWEKEYFSNQDKPRNPEKAFRHYLMAAKHGSEKSQNMIGVMYSRGDGVKQDYDKANFWWEKAAKQGHSWAIANLGRAYLEGRGFQKDKAKAIELLEESAALGNGEAKKTLAFLTNNTSEVTDIILQEVDSLLERQKHQDDAHRDSAVYKELKKIDHESGAQSLAVKIFQSMQTNLKASHFKAMYLYLDDRLSASNAHDPEYYMLDGLVSSLYASLIEEKTVQNYDVFFYSKLRDKEVFRFYQWLLISHEDLARCIKPLEQKSKKLFLAETKFKEKYKDYFRKRKSEFIENQVLKLSENIKGRKANQSFCLDGKTVSDSEWFGRRELVIEEFLARNFQHP